MQKLYCYVDETGQDTLGTFFLVSVIVIESERDEANTILEAAGQKSGKGKVKWRAAKLSLKQAYIEAILAERLCQGRLTCSVYKETSDYLRDTAHAVHLAIAHFATTSDYKATIIVDGLEGSNEQLFRNYIRDFGIRFKTVRGVKDEANAFVRLADALSGFARAGLEEHEVFTPMLKQAQAKNYILEL